MDWKEKIKKIMRGGCTDSDIEDFIDEHPELDAGDIWDYVFEYDAPDACKGCRNIQMLGMFPCNYCTRRVKLKDYYEHR